MQAMVAKQLVLAKLPPEDAADALALAICHIHNHARLALADVKQL
jgi:Holliday junction resolvasome RuvABC endonuclease subunit